jgi:serine phosphatase RsbU (regulator of sigma subunit)
MKNPLNRLSSKSLRLLFALIFLFIFSLCTLNAISILFVNALSNDENAWRPVQDRLDALVITDVVPGGVSDKAGLKNGDTLIKINGQSFNTNDPLKNPVVMVNAIPKGEFATYLIQRDGRQFEVKVEIIKVINFAFIANYLFGLGFIIVGFIVVMTKPNGKVQRLFAYFSLFIILLFSLNSQRFDLVQNRVYAVIVTSIVIISRVFASSVFILFFNYFPVKRKNKGLMRDFWIIAFINLVITLIAFFVIDRNTPGANIIAPILLNFPAGFFIAGLFIFTHSYFKYVEQERKKQLKPILIGALIGLLVFLYTQYIARTNEFLIFLNPWIFLPTLLVFCMPITFGYSIFKYRIMDIDFFIKKSIIYAIITATIASIYVLLVFGAGNIIGGIFGHAQNQTLSIVALVVIAFVFDPLKRKVQDWIDKVFYRERYNYQKILFDFSQKLPSQVDQRQIVNSVVNTIANAMHVDKVAVAIDNENNGLFFTGRNITEQEYRNLNVDKLCPYFKEDRECCLTANIKDNLNPRVLLTDNEKSTLKQSGIELIIPILLQDKLVGTINAGKKLSQRYYSEEDIELLMTVANQTAIAIENSRLYEQEKAYMQVKEELKLAANIQLQWLPKESPKIKGFDIAGKTRPAEVVGGDYYDFIQVSDDKLAVCIGDVSGKGLSAALLMANLHAIVRSQSFVNTSPRESVSLTNKMIYESSRDDMFITLFYGLIDTKQKQFTYTNGGHNFPLYINQDGNIKGLDTDGLVIGINSKVKYSENHLFLRKNDSIILYSDGIIDAFDIKGNQFGEERLNKLIKEHIELSSEDLINKIFTEVESFSNGNVQFDDMTMVVVKVTE